MTAAATVRRIRRIRLLFFWRIRAARLRRSRISGLACPAEVRPESGLADLPAEDFFPLEAAEDEDCLFPSLETFLAEPAEEPEGLRRCCSFLINTPLSDLYDSSEFPYYKRCFGDLRSVPVPFRYTD